MKGRVVLFAVALTLVGICTSLPSRCILRRSPSGGLTMQNEFVSFDVDTTNAVITFFGDLRGTSNFSVPAGTFYLEDIVADAHAATRSASVSSVRVISNTTEMVSVLLRVSDAQNISVDTWVVTVTANSRSGNISTSGHVTKNTTNTAKAITHTFAMQGALSNYALYAQGLIQMLGAPSDKQWFGSNDSLHRTYGLGAGACLDIQPKIQKPTVLNVQSSMVKTQFVLAGTYNSLDMWGKGWDLQSNIPITTDMSWNTVYAISANNRNFPTMNLTTGPNLPENDLTSLLTGVYATSIGSLSTYPNSARDGSNAPLHAHVAYSAPTINKPDRSYVGNYNFFDPDNFLTMSSLLYSGDPYLQDQARQVIEQNEKFMKDDGQMLHHFNGLTPIYIALAGVKQTGPNIFWTKAAMQYATSTNNIEWLENHMKSLRLSVTFCTNLIEQDSGMLYAPGSLMIDCFLRENYTSDSNAMMPGFLRQYSTFEQFAGNSTGAKALDDMASRMIDAMNNGPFSLWDSDSNDHYVTNKNLDGSTRDFVDYDANLIAVANYVSNDTQSAAILERIDRGFCTHARPTFVSEKWYGPADTLPIGNTGDSWTSMGRIAWFDAWARRRMGELDVLNNEIIDPIVNDVVTYTWLTERFGCDSNGKPTDPGGSQNRSSHFFEFPSVAVMLLREIRYGINIGVNTISISPFGPTEYAYHIGNIDVDFSSTKVRVCIPGPSRTFAYTIEPLKPLTWFDIAQDESCGTNKQRVMSSNSGQLSFTAPAGGCCLDVAA